MRDPKIVLLAALLIAGAGAACKKSAEAKKAPGSPAVDVKMPPRQKTGAPAQGLVSPVQTIRLFRDEAPNDPKNRKQVHIADVQVGSDGGLELAAAVDETYAVKLLTTLQEIRSKELKMNVKERRDIGGKSVVAVRAVSVPPQDPQYPQAVAHFLMMKFGFGYKLSAVQ